MCAYQKRRGMMIQPKILSKKGRNTSGLFDERFIPYSKIKNDAHSNGLTYMVTKLLCEV